MCNRDQLIVALLLLCQHQDSLHEFCSGRFLSAVCAQRGLRHKLAQNLAQILTCARCLEMTESLKTETYGLGLGIFLIEM